LDDQTIEAAIDYGRPLELPPRGLYTFYRAFCDASGGVGADSYTLAVGHKEGEHFVIDLVRGTGGKFDPDVVTQEYAALLREYRVFQVTGDSYAGQWVAGPSNNNLVAARSGAAMSALTIALLLASTVLAAAQNQTTFRDASGRITGTVSTDANGTKTFRDGSGRTTSTATRDSNGTTTFRDAGGRTTGTASTSRR
jgi:YD repeat-containing protein